MTLILLLTACGKHEQPAKKQPWKGQPAKKVESKPKRTMATIPAILNQAKINPSDVFTVSRNGNLVTIRWNVDFSTCNGIKILRNPTGLPKIQKIAAVLPRTSKEFVDNVVEPRAYWYWLSIALPDGKYKNIGPLKAPEDTGKVGTYANPSDEVQFTAQRNGNSVVLAWNFPNVKYKNITVYKNSVQQVMRKRDSRTTIHQTLEWQGEFVDQLPDTDADFWYVVEAVRQDGSTVTKGPIKAQIIPE